ncbi:MAG: hemolysin III family protein [Maribacter sp.]
MAQVAFQKVEEQLNTISHAVGVLFALFGMFILVTSTTHTSFLSTVSIYVYSFSLIALLGISTGYHAVNKPVLKRRLRILDHINIYYLIAGTYTPVALITLVHGNGWLIFYMVWGFALFGTVLKLFFTGKYEMLSLLLYLIMGWLIIFDCQNLMDNVSDFGSQLLLVGGAFYTVGILFYAIKKIPFNHFIWHLFVLGGAASHWFFIYLEVI